MKAMCVTRNGAEQIIVVAVWWELPTANHLIPTHINHPPHVLQLASQRIFPLLWFPEKKYRKAVRWCASLIRSHYGLIALIWIGLLDLWVDWTDLVYLIGWLNEWIQYIISVDVCPISCISWVLISWDITPESKYLMVADFMRYYTRIKIRL